jgi:hypothetical protein
MDENERGIKGRRVNIKSAANTVRKRFVVKYPVVCKAFVYRTAAIDQQIAAKIMRISPIIDTLLYRLFIREIR